MRSIATLCLAAVMLVQVPTASSQATLPAFAPLPQDTGAPYTRTARPRAIEWIRTATAIFPGSRYAYVMGVKARLDPEHILDGEAVIRDGRVLVPAEFAPYLASPSVRWAPAPEYLEDRWVYTASDAPDPTSTARLARFDVGGRPYVSVADVAAAAHLQMTTSPEGVVLVGAAPPDLSTLPLEARQAIVTLFDTPEKYADPSIAPRYIPTLKRQGTIDTHARITPEQLALLSGPETAFPSVPDSQYDLTGFNASLLGSKVPAPGEFPRLLFSVADIPEIAKRIQSSKYGQMSLIEQELLFKKSWWDPKTSDGQLFVKLSTGDLTGLRFPDAGPDVNPSAVPQLFEGEKPGIFNSHIAYVPECLTTMAFWALIHGDDALGRKVATAIVSYYRLREPYIDEWNAYSDSEFGGTAVRPDGRTVRFDGNGSETHWRGMHANAAHMDLAFALDFGGKWMTDAQKASMYRVIAKATYGRRAYGEDAPVRFRDVNWVSWDLPQFLALTAIEGQAGFDPEAWEQGRRTVRAFLDFGLDANGQMWESNGKSGGGFQFQILSMVALARRGENLWGHPHLRKMLQAQVQCTSPNGELTVSGGTFAGTAFALQSTDELKAFFPGDRCADYLLTQGTSGRPPLLQSAWEMPAGVPLQEFDPAAYRAKLLAKNGMSRLRLPSVTYPNFVRSVLYDTDWQPTTKADLNLPLNWSDPIHGVCSFSSDRTTDATWVNVLVRPNHYMGAGHHHSDAGMFQFAALGVNWVTEAPFNMSYDGKYHNQVTVDGESEPGQFPARAAFLGSALGSDGASASADLTYAYSWRWCTQPSQVWPDDLARLPWELEPATDVLSIYAGTARYKFRPWWSSQNYSNFTPTCRAPFNPMQYVYRTVGLTRGAMPYAFVVDDLKKDASPHLYEWTAILGPGVWQASVDGLPSGGVALGFQRQATNAKLDAAHPAALLVPAKGDPLVLVLPIAPSGSGDPSVPLVSVSSLDGPPDRQGKPVPYNRLTISRRAVEAHFRVLLVPFRYGDPIPTVVLGPTEDEAALLRAGDTLTFTTRENRTHVKVTRGQQVIAENP